MNSHAIYVFAIATILSGALIYIATPMYCRAVIYLFDKLGAFPLKVLFLRFLVIPFCAIFMGIWAIALEYSRNNGYFLDSSFFEKNFLLDWKFWLLLGPILIAVPVSYIAMRPYKAELEKRGLYP